MKFAFYEGVPVEIVSISKDSSDKFVVAHPNGAKVVKKSELESMELKEDGNKR